MKSNLYRYAVAGVGEVAFTQPTEAGRSLALSVCGAGTGTFLVY